jgi:hypothetical protein
MMSIATDIMIADLKKLRKQQYTPTEIKIDKLIDAFIEFIEMHETGCGEDDVKDCPLNIKGFACIRRACVWWVEYREKCGLKNGE